MTSFAGLPVSGRKLEGATFSNQKPIEELQPLIQALLDDDTIVEFGWRQYTPYFNDGDVCEFGVHSLWVRTVDDGDEFSTYDLELDNVRYEECEGVGYRDWRSQKYHGKDEARFDRAEELDSAIQSGSFDKVLAEAFGDHALVTFTKTGITIDQYDHD